MCLNYKSLFLLRFPALTTMDGTSAINYNSDMEEEERTKYPPYQWTQQDTNSPIIKFEPETRNEKPGKWQLWKCPEAM